MTIGDIITILVFLGGLIGNYVVMDRKITRAETRLDYLEKNAQEFRDTIREMFEKVDRKLEKLIDLEINRGQKNK